MEKGLDRLFVFVDAVNELLGCVFNYRFICVVPLLGVEIATYIFVSLMVFANVHSSHTNQVAFSRI